MEASRHLANARTDTYVPVTRMISELGMIPRLVAMSSLPDNVFITQAEAPKPRPIQLPSLPEIDLEPNIDRGYN